jgi:hypothetical protein
MWLLRSFTALCVWGAPRSADADTATSRVSGGLIPGWGPTPVDARIFTTVRCQYMEDDGSWQDWNDAAMPHTLEFYFGEVAVGTPEVRTSHGESDGYAKEWFLPAALVPGRYTVRIYSSPNGGGPDCYTLETFPIALEADLDIGSIDEDPVLLSYSHVDGDTVAPYAYTYWQLPEAPVGGWVLELRHAGHDHVLGWYELHERGWDSRSLDFDDDVFLGGEEVCLTGRIYTPYHEVDRELDFGCSTAPTPPAVDAGCGCRGASAGDVALALFAWPLLGGLRRRARGEEPRPPHVATCPVKDME